MNSLGCNGQSIIIGHSSGAAAAMRLVEKHKVAGLVLVAAYDSDLGDELERNSGYFSRDWDWGKIQDNAKFIVQFGGALDNLVPIQVQRRVAKKLGSQFHEIGDGDHFFTPPFPQLIDSISENMKTIEGSA
ncbi:hypothetical protein CYMTET_14978 [Cymbomonas tetramitiformis]|uniref:Uncharacterized protein n=1 Tax=Cymbomonas tetramitiformis TaxID=36881 RepID=A0AAE0GGF9_9CHLO|nr:hypothetical protein CYMTET_14978 [Cymbomonas tetramitiformis]